MNCFIMLITITDDFISDPDLAEFESVFRMYGNYV
jgi:hypothetical protein